MENLFYLNKEIEEAQNVVIYGAGNYGKEIAEYFADIGIKVAFFCDSNSKKSGQRIKDIEVIEPEKLLELNNICIVIASIKAWKQIYDNLIKMGIDKKRIVSNVGLNNMCMIKKEILQDKKVLIAGADEFGLRLLYKLLDAGIYVEGFLDDNEALRGGSLLNKKILSGKEIHDGDDVIIIYHTREEIEERQGGVTVFDNSFLGWQSSGLFINNIFVNFRVLHYLALVQKSRKIVIYGSDECAEKCEKVLKLLDIKTEYFIDEKEEGRELSGKQIKSMYDLLYEEDKCYIYICGEKAQKDYETCRMQLIELGFEEGLDFVPSWERNGYHIFDPHLGYIPITSASGKDYRGFCTFEAGEMKGKYKVLVLGGSTSDPYYMPFKSWCEILRDTCARNGWNVEVICGGSKGYFSAQELLKLIRDGIWMEPDLVISYSGLNDIYERGEYPFLCDYQKELCAYFDDKQKGLVSSRGVRRKRESAYHNWLIHMCMIHGILSEFAIPFLAIGQPSSWAKMGEKDIRELEYQILHKSLLADERSYESAIKNACEMRENVKRDTERLEWLEDFSDIFDGKSGMYVDVVHCSEEGNRIIAEKVYQLLEEKYSEDYKKIHGNERENVSLAERIQ